MGADKVITIDINSGRAHGTNSLSLLNVARASLRIAISNSSEKGLINSDIIIAPDLAKFRATKKDGSEEMIEIGYKAAKDRMKEVLELIGKR